jgi:hypothetical protein
MAGAPALTILSGGQSGVDRGALDAALAFGVRCGGWCPEGRIAEDGTIPDRYPVTPLPGADYAARTRRNVLDSDGTVILAFGEASGGTRHTLECCREENRPHLLVDAQTLDSTAAAQRIAGFVTRLPRGLLNVAGPRASEAPGAHAYARETLERLFRVLRDRELAAGGGFPRWADPQSAGDRARPEPETMTRFCHSCAAPLDAPGFAGPAENFCRYCTHADGTLKKKKEIRKGIARWMQSWQPDLDDETAAKRARRYMRSMPAWCA